MSCRNGYGLPVLALAGWLQAAGAATFQVTSVTDAVDAVPGDGRCATAEGQCTLRAAVQEANALSGVDTVQLPAGTYVLALGAAGEEAAAGGDLDVLEELQVFGAGPEAIIDGNYGDRLFQTAAGVSLRLESLTLQHGQVAEGHGGAVLAEGPLELVAVSVSASTAPGQGGGIYAADTVALSNSVLADNTADTGGGLYLGALGSATLDGVTVDINKAREGAGLYALGALTVRTSTITGNSADVLGGGAYVANGRFEATRVAQNGAAEAGAGIYAQGGALTVHRSRFDANRLTSDYGKGAGLYAGQASTLTLTESALTGNGIDKPTSSGATYGGGLYFAGVTFSGENTTFSGNQADVGGGLAVAAGSGLVSYSTLAENQAASGANLAVTGTAALELHASLLAGPTAGANCDGTVTSLGYNLASDASCALASTGDLSNAEAGLTLLDDATGTHALTALSAAIDAGDPLECPLYDGAGFVRADERCDVGARESNGAPAEGGTLRFALAASEANETAGTVTFSVIREGGNIPVSVDYKTLAESATAGVDYLPAEGQLTWAADDTAAKSITLTVPDDTLYEAAETLQLVLSGARGGAVLGTPSSHTLTLLDDDPEPQDPPPEEPPPEEPPPEEPPPEETCLQNGPNCLPPGIEKKGGGALDPLWLLAALAVFRLRRRQTA